MLELQDISFKVTDETTTKEKEILKNINLTVDDKTFFVITGPNGGGKSTLAKIIMGIQKPTSGKILFNGTDVTNMNITERAKAGIGFAFQQPVRFKGLTIRDLISLSVGKELSMQDACKYLSEVGLCAMDYVNREANSSLSGGELKRIEIATVIARGTELSIFDEPEAGIDLWSFQNLIRVFKELRDSRNASIIIVSHQERILEIADRIVVLANGEITKDGTKEDILPSLIGEADACRYYKGDE